VYDIVSDIIDTRYFGFWVVTACVKGVYVVYELIIEIEEGIINPLK
jgi:hypothetical protein